MRADETVLKDSQCEHTPGHEDENEQKVPSYEHECEKSQRTMSERMRHLEPKCLQEYAHVYIHIYLHTCKGTTRDRGERRGGMQHAVVHVVENIDKNTPMNKYIKLVRD